MPKLEYESLRSEDRIWQKLQRLGLIVTAIVVAVYICSSTVFPADVVRRPFCGGLRLQPLPLGATSDLDRFRGVFVLTDQETVDYFWIVLFVPSVFLFSVSVLYLIAGSVRCLSILNLVFSIMYPLLAVVLGSSLLSFGSSCSVPLFWCYEVVCWGLAILFGGTSFFLRRKSAQILDEYVSPSSRNAGLELLETNSDIVITPEVERRVHESFKSWMGYSLISSDNEDEPDQYAEAPHATFVHERV